MIEGAALAFGIAEQIDVDAILAALEIEIDQRSRPRARCPPGTRTWLVGANLLAHDDDLVPLAGRRTIARRLQRLGRLQKGILVPPDEIDFQQLEAQVAAVRLTLQGNAHEVGRLVVQTIGHVKIRLGQWIALIEIDRTLARHRIVGRLQFAGVAETCRIGAKNPARHAGRTLPPRRTDRPCAERSAWRSGRASRRHPYLP